MHRRKLGEESAGTESCSWLVEAALSGCGHWMTTIVLSMSESEPLNLEITSFSVTETKGTFSGLPVPFSVHSIIYLSIDPARHFCQFFFHEKGLLWHWSFSPRRRQRGLVEKNWKKYCGCSREPSEAWLRVQEAMAMEALFRIVWWKSDSEHSENED